MEIPYNMPQWRSKLKNFFDHPWIHTALGVLILVNIITLGLEISRTFEGDAHQRLVLFNNVILGVFAVEILGRLIGEGRSFFKDGWHIFDFIVVTLALVSFGGVIQAFRTLRILWLLRMLTIAPRFKHLINSIIQAVPNIFIVGLLLILAIYISALVATAEFGTTNAEYSGVLKSMSTLTTTILMEHTWSERYEALVEHYPYAWAYVFPVMIILNYLLLHLVIGVIVTALHKQYEEEEESRKHHFLGKFLQKTHHGHENPFSPETKAILQSLEELKSLMAKSRGS